MNQEEENKSRGLELSKLPTQTNTLDFEVPLPLKSSEIDSKTDIIDEMGLDVFNRRIILNPGISRLNFYASLVHITLNQFSHAVTTTLQPLILLDPSSYNVNKGEVGVILAKLMLIQTLAKICITPFSGYFVDRIGRKPMILLGSFILLLGYLFVPYQTSVFPGYVLSKIFVANGGNLMYLAPLIADYVHDSTKGKATGISMALGSAGQFLGTLFVTLLIAMKISLSSIHVIAGITIFGITILYSFGIKEGKYYLAREKNQNDNISQLEKINKDDLLKKLQDGFSALNKNGWLMISLIINTLARADYYLVTIIFALFVKSFDQTPSDTHNSNKLITIYQDLFFGLSFFCNLAYSVILDKVNTLKIIFPTMSLVIIGYVLGVFATTKDSSLLLLLILFAGIAMPGLINSGHYLAIKHFPKELRGMLSSLLSVIGIAGYLFLSTVGGYLFDNWGRSAPFLVFASMLTAALLGILYICKKEDLIEQNEKVELYEDQDQAEEWTIKGSI